MHSLDVLYYSLSLAVLVLVGIVAYVAYNLVLTLKAVQRLVQQGSDITESIQSMKEKINVQALMPMVFGTAGFFGKKLFKKIF